MSDQSGNNPIHKNKEEYGDSFNTHLLEQYKVYVQSAENSSMRRITTSRYLLTLSVALLALSGLQSATFNQNYLPLIFTAGILVSLLWYDIIKSYRDLNTVKFEIIHKLEKHLPARPYDCEWKVASKGKSKYIPVTWLERWVPCLFIVAHIASVFITIYTPYQNT